jgi:predicted glycosyltransferase
VRAWVDLTNSPHVLVMRPMIELLREKGWDVDVTARDFAQTVGLLDRFGIDHEVIGHHRGGGRGSKAVGLASRSFELTRWAKGRNFDLALGHGSNDITVASWLLRIPCSTTFDYEFATVQHQVNCHLADAVVVPALIPKERIERFGARGKLFQYAGLKEEYYLSAFEPDLSVPESLGVDVSRPWAVVRTPPAVALYHRVENDLFGQSLELLADHQAVVLPRTPEQREQLREVKGLIIPEQAVDAQSLVALADLVISAGGTMNREAVALGTPVLTVFAGKLGAVDEYLLDTGLLGRLTDPKQAIPIRNEGASRPERVRRDPEEFLQLLMRPLARKAGRG